MKNLAAKYRPVSADDLVGQPKAKAALQMMCRTGKFPKVLIFEGAYGCGKTTIAKILAMAVNCKDRTLAGPCGQCEECLSIMDGTSSNVLELDAASHNGVGDIKPILDRCGYKRSGGECMVFIIDECHMLTRDAWNAMLKTLEEPPEGVMFIFCTTEINKVPATIISRSQHYTVEAIKPEDIFGRLKYVCAKEGKQYEDGALALIAAKANGHMRDALSLLESVFEYDTITEKVVADRMGLTGEEKVFDLLDAVASGNVHEALGAVDSAMRSGSSVKGLVREVIGALDDAESVLLGTPVEAIVEPQSYKARLERLVRESDLDRLDRFAASLHDVLASTGQDDIVLKLAIRSALTRESRFSAIENHDRKQDERLLALESGNAVTRIASIPEQTAKPEKPQPVVLEGGGKVAEAPDEKSIRKPETLKGQKETDVFDFDSAPAGELDDDLSGFDFSESEQDAPAAETKPEPEKPASAPNETPSEPVHMAEMPAEIEEEGAIPEGSWPSDEELAAMDAQFEENCPEVPEQFFSIPEKTAEQPTPTPAKTKEDKNIVSFEKAVEAKAKEVKAEVTKEQAEETKPASNVSMPDLSKLFPKGTVVNVVDSAAETPKPTPEEKKSEEEGLPAFSIFDAFGDDPEVLSAVENSPVAAILRKVKRS